MTGTVPSVVVEDYCSIVCICEIGRRVHILKHKDLRLSSAARKFIVTLREQYISLKGGAAYAGSDTVIEVCGTGRLHVPVSTEEGCGTGRIATAVEA